MNYLEELVANLYKYLVNKEVLNSNIIRQHTRELEQIGELSFPFNICNWHNKIERNQLQDDIQTIFQYLSIKGSDASTDILIKQSKTWPLHISKCFVQNSNVHIYLDRTNTFRQVIQVVYLERDSYGRCKLNVCNDICIEHLEDNKFMNLSELRLSLLKKVAVNMLRLCNINVTNTVMQCTTNLTFALKSENGKIVLCGPVLNDKGLKDLQTTAEQFFKKRTTDMRLMAEHKYGLRVTSQNGWEEFFEKLGEAAVIIELLQNKPSHKTKININDHTLTSSKGASFILYNCARLAALFKEFDKRVSSKIYPKLPAISEIDFGLLNEPEEWELLYVHILQFPTTIKNCIKDIIHCKFNPHFLISALSGLSLTFSVYYRRVRILTEPREHLFPVLHARIYLLKALEQVVHNGLLLLNIQPVKQM